MAELPPELGPMQPPMQEQPSDGFRQQIGPLAETGGPVGAFISELLGIADDLGFLDEAFGPETIQDQTDLQDVNADPMEFLNKDQLTTLVNLFLAIPEPQRSQIGNQLRDELPPQVASRLDAIVRFVQGRDAQLEVAR
tara:strand:- start:2106 stop:2519 length:414 start_codon:yes stop_codon:yes gene_type:complete